MCGIAGIVEAKENQALMSEMLDMIAHRGPDAKSIFQNGPFCLGHRRLSIIDLEGGDQPIFNEDKTVCVVLNGEIYNYQSLRKELQKQGHQFRTQSDTEVLVHLYEQYGEQFFARLNGIFAFSLLDIAKQRLFLVRDQFGVKPMHYYAQAGLMVFGSEQKSMLLHPSVPRKLNWQSLHFHLNQRFTQSEQTLFEGIRRLPAGSYLRYEGGQFQIEKYYQLPISQPLQISEEEACEGLHVHLKQAVERQLVSDVPVGVYLSGGLDSSAIVQKMHELGVPQINTFTLGFNEPTDEFPDARRIVDQFGTNHHELSLSLNPMQQFPQVLWHAEEPKINLLQGFNMSKFVSPKVKVVLGGLGGDELLAGYDVHKFLHHTSRFGQLPKWLQQVLRLKSSWLFKLQNASGTLSLDEYRRGVQVLLAAGDVERMYLILRNVWDYDRGMYHNVYAEQVRPKMEVLAKQVSTYAKLFSSAGSLKALESVLYAEFQTKMVNDYLLVEDRMSMSHSVEERVPFLDKDFVEYAFSIPLHLKIKHGQTKYLFRKAMQSHLPPKIIDKKKWGFTVNPYLQFTKDLKTVAERILTPEAVEQQGIFNYRYLQQIMQHKPHPKMRWHYNFLWVALGISIWEKMFIQTDNFKNKEFDLEAYYS